MVAGLRRANGLDPDRRAGLLLLVEWRLAYGKGFRWFLWTACLTLAAGPLLGLRMDPSSLVIVLLPFILLLLYGTSAGAGAMAGAAR
jgi:hypothetical protein